MLMFKELNTSGSGSLSLEEFYSVYDAVMLKWEAQFSQIPWFHTTWAPLQTFCQFTHDFVTWKYFDYIVCKHLDTLSNISSSDHKETAYILFLFPLSKYCSVIFKFALCDLILSSIFIYLTDAQLDCSKKCHNFH